MPMSKFCRFHSASHVLFLGTLLPLLLSACFSGQSGREKNPDNSNSYDTVRLTQLAVPNNDAYCAILDDLDRNNLQNIDKALLLFANNKADSLGRDSMLVAFNEFMNSVMQEYYAARLIGNRKLMDQFENKEDQAESKKLILSLAEHGINLSYREGDFYLEPNLVFVSNHLKGALTAGSKDYLKTKISLSTGGYIEKSEKLSPPDSLAHQIVAWEEFLQKNPNYMLKDEIQAQYIDVLAAYLSGLEQLPLFDANTKMLEPTFQASYIRYIEEYPDRESTKTVKKFYDLLASKGFKYDESLDSFLSEVNFIPTQNPQ